MDSIIVDDDYDDDKGEIKAAKGFHDEMSKGTKILEVKMSERLAAGQYPFENEIEEMFSMIGYLREKVEELKGIEQSWLFERRAFTKMTDIYKEFTDNRRCDDISNTNSSSSNNRHTATVVVV